MKLQIIQSPHRNVVIEWSFDEICESLNRNLDNVFNFKNQCKFTKNDTHNILDHAWKAFVSEFKEKTVTLK